MQYYYECLEVYEKLFPEVKKHCKAIRKCDDKFIVIQRKHLEALKDFEEQKEYMSPSSILANENVLEKSKMFLAQLAEEKLRRCKSLIVTVEYYLSRINGYVREFKCELDGESPGTSIELERKFMELNRKRLKEIQEMREEYADLDAIFKIPENEPEVSEPVAETPIERETKDVAETKINGHRQNIRQIYNKLVSGLTEDQPGIRTNQRKNSFKIKAERRGSINNGTPSPRAMSPRLPRVHKFSTTETSTLTVPDSGPASTSVSPMETSPGPHGNSLSFNYSDSNLAQFSTMPSFSGSQESRHGRQRKFTQKAQQMFKEQKHGPGRPSNHHYQANFPASTTSEPSQPSQQSTTIPQQPINNSNNIQPTQIKTEIPIHPIASSSYSFPQDYARPAYPTSQQQYIYTTPYVNSHSQMPAPTAPHPMLQPPRMQPPPQPQQQFFRQGPQVRLTIHNGTNGDDSINDEEEGDDSTWCFCGEHSYGSMIECENKDCPYRWFHYQCVGISKSPMGLWYCPECSHKLST